MATRILRDDFGCFRGQEREIDVKPDEHLVRVFARAGLSDGDSDTEAMHAARRLNPEFPGETGLASVADRAGLVRRVLPPSAYVPRRERWIGVLKMAAPSVAAPCRRGRGPTQRSRRNHPP